MMLFVSHYQEAIQLDLCLKKEYLCDFDCFSWIEFQHPFPPSLHLFCWLMTSNGTGVHALRCGVLADEGEWLHRYQLCHRARACGAPSNHQLPLRFQFTTVCRGTKSGSNKSVLPHFLPHKTGPVLDKVSGLMSWSCRQTQKNWKWIEQLSIELSDIVQGSF